MRFQKHTKHIFVLFTVENIVLQGCSLVHGPCSCFQCRYRGREILASLARSLFFSLGRETFSGHYAEEIQGLLPMSNFRIMSSFSEISFSSTLLIINYYILQQQYPSKLALKWSLHRLCTVLFSWLTLTGLSLCQPFKLTIC